MPFKISEFCITYGDVPQDVADKILTHHIVPMLVVRKEMGAPITASQNSGYRSYKYERSKGRSGNSQHTFKGKGAVDWKAKDLDKLEELIIKHTDYTRVTRYKNFIHCDYAPTAGNHRQYFVSGGDSKWKFIKNLD